VVKNQKDIAIGNILGSNIFNIFLVLAVTVIVYGDPIFFNRSNFFDYTSVSVLSFLFVLVVISRQTFGRILGILTLAYYPLSLVVRVLYFS
jgi:cation:H+ antiporter